MAGGELDELYNCTSGLLPRGKKHPYIENVYSGNRHHSLWAEYKRKFKNTHFVNKNGQIDLTDVRCIDGYFFTLLSFENIWNYGQNHESAIKFDLFESVFSYRSIARF